ncbi:pyridoxamine 5'-phosphate oxidase family protein [Streptomyces sp. NPDC060194]|uniref:pyridoxamine 5'-phosphate oxidase family protein n=1 Tax=Streptomyces sp. NPDC060194 TaxID=3347069 RepID=UPI00365C8B62
MTIPPLSWADFEAAQPGFARTVRDRFAAYTHHTLATLRRDGSPRTSGTEVTIRFGEVLIGSMPGAVKALDLLRDPRLTLQANHGEGDTMGGGDVRVGGRAVEVGEDEELFARCREEVGAPAGPFHLFRVELSEVVRTAVEGDELCVTLWRPGAEPHTFRRK